MDVALTRPTIEVKDEAKERALQDALLQAMDRGASGWFLCQARDLGYTLIAQNAPAAEIITQVRDAALMPPPPKERRPLGSRPNRTSSFPPPAR